MRDCGRIVGGCLDTRMTESEEHEVVSPGQQDGRLLCNHVICFQLCNYCSLLVDNVE